MANNPAPDSHLAPGANVRMSGGLPLIDPMINFNTPQRPLPWGPDAFAGPGGLPLGPGREGSPSRGDQLQFRYWVPAFWPPEMQEPEAPTEPGPTGDAPTPREFTYPTETLPHADPPPMPDFINHPNTQMLPSGQYMPNVPWIPSLNQMDDQPERQGYDAGGTIAGMPIGGGSGGMTLDQLNSQYPMAQMMRGNPELLRPLTEMFENIQVPGEIGPAEQLRGMSQFPFQNLGRTMGLTPLSSDQIWQRMMESGYSDPRTGAQNIYDYMMQDPGNSNRVWEYLDPTWPVDFPQSPQAPIPEEPAPAPSPTPAPIPRQEYTYPTETLPQAEGPSQPSFMSHFGAPNFGSPHRWIPPIQPLRPMDNQGLMPHARGGHVRARRGYADGGALNAQQGGLQPIEHRKGGRVNDINRARLRAVVSAKRGDFNG